MKFNMPLHYAALYLVASLFPFATFAQSTAFTYQGRLNDGPNVAGGTYDLRFAIYDSASGGVQQGNAITNSATVISNGLFTVTLDLGNQFPGADRWLEIGVRTNNGGAFTTLSPRQPITATPYAVQAANASSVAAANISGTVALSQLPSSLVTNGANGVTLTGSFSGNGAGVTNVNVSTLRLHQLPVIAWGDNQFGQTDVPAGLGNVMSIAAGAWHILALKSNGTVVAWGNNSNGQTNVPPGLSAVKAIAGGGYHSLALRSDGVVFAWGNNQYHQTNLPAGLNNVTAIAGGMYHSLALKNDGTVVAWGDNVNGKTNVPAGLSNVVAIAAGAEHSLALKNDGAIVGWGFNVYGQATAPAGLSNVTAIAAGALHTLALKNDGTVVAWGFNFQGQANVPAGLSNVTAISAGTFHSLALKSDGAIVGWGGGTEVGIPPGSRYAVAIACGAYYSVALRAREIPAQVALLDQDNFFLQAVTATGVRVPGSGVLEFGAGIAAKEFDAGKIGYQIFSDGLDIVGAGADANSRKITFFAEGGAMFNGPVSAPSFAGNGANLTALNASQIASGTMTDARLSTNVALLNGTNVFTGMLLGSAPYLKYVEATTGTTQGGTANAGTNNWRKFNVEIADPYDLGATNGAGDIILPAGTYHCRVSAPAYGVQTHQIRLRTSSGTTLLYGTTAYSTGVNDRSIIEGQFTLAGPTTLRVQHWCFIGNGGNGLGGLDNDPDIWGDAPNFNVFATADFWKIK